MALSPADEHLAKIIRALPDSRRAIQEWKRASQDLQAALLRYLPACCLTEDFFAHLIAEGRWIWRRSHLYANEEFGGEVRQAAVTAADRVLQKIRSGSQYIVPVEDVMTFLRDLAAAGAVLPHQSTGWAEWALGAKQEGDESWARPTLAALLLDFPGLGPTVNESLLHAAEKDLAELLGHPDGEMEENSDHPLLRLVCHEGTSMQTLKAIAAARQAGLAHDEMLRIPRICEMTEVISLLIPHTDPHRLSVILARGPAELFMPALHQMLEVAPQRGAEALRTHPRASTLTAEELLPFLSSSHSEVRIQAMLLASKRNADAEAAVPSHSAPPRSR